jgi:hypothetical protein
MACKWLLILLNYSFHRGTCDSKDDRAYEGTQAKIFV